MTLFDLLPNYTGPYISNGQFQESVEFGDVEPKDYLDALSRLHDSIYAKWDDRLHRSVGDIMYTQAAQKLEGLFPQLAGGLVSYGNQTINSFNTIKDAITNYGPFGLIIGGLKNLWDMNQLVTREEEIRKEILEYLETDPFPQFQREKTMGNLLAPVIYPSEFDTKRSKPNGSINKVAVEPVGSDPIIDVGDYNPNIKVGATPFVNDSANGRKSAIAHPMLGSQNEVYEPDAQGVDVRSLQYFGNKRNKRKFRVGGRRNKRQNIFD